MSDDLQGVFNFIEHFPGPHMVRVRLSRLRAWEVMRQLTSGLEGEFEEINFAWFGTLLRDAEEDRGNPIEVETSQESV